MVMSNPSTPAKRPHDSDALEPNAKRHQSLLLEKSTKGAFVGGCVLRIVCPAVKIDNVVGEGGSGLVQIRQETGAEVSVEEQIHGCEERVVVIVGSDNNIEASAETVVRDNGNDKDVGGGNDETEGNDNAGVSGNDEESGEGKDRTNDEARLKNDERKDNKGNGDAGENDDDKQDHGNNGDKEENDAERGDLRSLKAIASAQKALLLVFDRMVDEGTGVKVGDDGNKRSPPVVARVLVLSTQVGCILGKGGGVIKQMSAESGAQMRILPRDKLPSCATDLDELIVISGRLIAVRKALSLVSQQLLGSPSRDRDQNPAIKSIGHVSYPVGALHHAEFHHPEHPFPVRGAHFGAGSRDFANYHPDLGPPPFPRFHEDRIPGHMALEMLTFRLLCLKENIGSIIGKGGNVIRTLQFETGADIKILEGVGETDDRIVVISAPVHPEDRIAAAQDAFLRVQSRILQAGANTDKTVQSRLLVSSNQIGCLLGKGGAIIAEMRKLSGAHIRILGKDQVPKCALENEEVVQITGEYEAVQEALFQISSRLRDHIFRDKFPGLNLPMGPGFRDSAPPPFSPFSGRREFLPPGIHKFDGIGGLPPFDDGPPFMRDMHRPGMAPFLPERAPWASKNIRINGGPAGLSDYDGVPQRKGSGFGGGNQPAVITSTTIEVVVPGALVPSIYGEDGFCLSKIREISEAKITITEPRPGATETTIIISGAPDETHAAQSLLQAFVMSETNSS